MKILVNYFILLIGMCVNTRSLLANELPNYIQVCHQSDPKFNECVVSSIEKLKPHLAKGLPELDVPPLEPLYLGDLTLVSGNGNMLKITANNVTVYGSGNFSIRKLRVTGKAEHIRLELNLPNLKVEGRYNADGQILTLPIKGNGRFTGNFNNLNTQVKIDTEIKELNDAERFFVKNIKLNTKMEKGEIKLFNLFNGDKQLNEIINDAINSNFDAISSEFIPIIEQELEIKFKQISDKISTKFTYQQLVPI